MAQEDGRNEAAAQTDEATTLKKRARRRLIGAAALALFAAIVLPMVMDHQPAPPVKDIQVRIPSPDEGVTQRVASKAAEKAEARPLATVEPKPESRPEPPAEAKAEPKLEAKPAAKPDAKPEVQSETKPETKPEAKAEPKAEPKSEPKAAAGESWEVQLGAYKEPGRVKLLTTKLNELGLPSYTEKVDTPAGPRTRVRAGPFPSQEAAEKAKARLKIIGVEGPVAKKP